jgi:DNA-binding GntR family transcriptional regulator
MGARDVGEGGDLLEPILAPDLVTHVAARVREAIMNGTFAQGDRLIEEQLAAQLNVSRAPVREALRQLEYDGLVTALGRRGRFVSILSPRDAWEVYTLRENLEAMAFSLVVGTCPSDVLTRADGIVDEMRTASAQLDLWTLSRLDVTFHRLIVETAHHDRLIRTWDSMSNQIGLLSRRVIGTQYDDLTAIPGRHQILVDVLRAGDVHEASDAIRSHIGSVAAQVVRRMETAGGQATDGDAARTMASHE